MSILPLDLDRVTYEAGGRPLVDRVSLRFAAGVPTVILGPNGAGKSLLLRLCHGLIRPTAGRVAWIGDEAERAQGRQAMVFQRPVLLRRSVAANVDYALATRGVARAERRARIAAVLRECGLSDLADRPARVLSGGEQQRLALARAWATRPEVLFMDEPTANLDPGATRAVEELARAIHAAGTKIVMTTHDLAQARRLAGEVVFLHKGQVVERAPADTFFAGPASADASAFLAGALLT
jgi:tungstate transport system ATP-binding protein